MLKVFAGRSHRKFAEEVCRHLGIEPGRANFHTFPNGNLKVRIEENARETDAFVIQTATPRNFHDRLMELLILIDALKYASAKRITAVIPYYFYVRSDKKDEPRISITARLIADLLETSGADRILTMNLHALQSMGFARIPVDQLDGIPIITGHLQEKDLKDFVAVAPDIGRAKVTEAYARRLGLPVVVLDKRRIDGEVVIRHVIGDVAEKNVIFFDDEVLTGGSILEGLKELRNRGARRFLAAVVHGVLAGGAVEKVEESPLEELVITDTLPLQKEMESPKITVLSVAELFAQAIKAIHTGGSVSALFR
jgi:ribose-phosphate pyrophosphokinase